VPCEEERERVKTNDGEFYYQQRKLKTQTKEAGSNLLKWNLKRRFAGRPLTAAHETFIWGEEVAQRGQQM